MQIRRQASTWVPDMFCNLFSEKSTKMTTIKRQVRDEICTDLKSLEFYETFGGCLANFTIKITL